MQTVSSENDDDIFFVLEPVTVSPAKCVILNPKMKKRYSTALSKHTLKERLPLYRKKDGKTTIPAIDFLTVNSDAVQKIGSGNSEAVASLKAFFHIIDADGGGSISVVEFVAALRVISQRLGRKFEHP